MILKTNFLKMIEVFKEEIEKKILKEIQKRTSKKLEEINKSLKEIQEGQEKNKKEDLLKT